MAALPDAPNPCIGIPLDTFVKALDWWWQAHQEVKDIDGVDWEQVRDIADDIMGNKLRPHRRKKSGK